LKQAFNATLGRTILGVQEANVSRPENEIAAVTFFAKIGAALTNSSAFASATERQDPEEHGY